MGDDYHAMAWALVTSAKAFRATMQVHGTEIIGHVPNYTNTAPVMLMGEVVANG